MSGMEGFAGIENERRMYGDDNPGKPVSPEGFIGLTKGVVKPDPVAPSSLRQAYHQGWVRPIPHIAVNAADAAAPNHVGGKPVIWSDGLQEFVHHQRKIRTFGTMTQDVS